jgi:hypothetical protein
VRADGAGWRLRMACVTGVCVAAADGGFAAADDDGDGVLSKRELTDQLTDAGTNLRLTPCETPPLHPMGPHPYTPWDPTLVLTDAGTNPRLTHCARALHCSRALFSPWRVHCVLQSCRALFSPSRVHCVWHYDRHKQRGGDGPRRCARCRRRRCHQRRRVRGARQGRRWPRVTRRAAGSSRARSRC